MPFPWRGRHGNGSSGMKAMRRQCRDKLASFGLPACYDLPQLCDHLVRVRGRELELVAMPMETSGPCGLWLSFPGTDYVVYEAHTSRHHQEHIIAHELAHMICGHHGVGVPGTDPGSLLFPDLDPSLVQDLLYRENYSDAQEQEAEVMAFLLGEALRAAPRGGAAAPDPDSALGRVHGSLNWRREDGS
ncbi:ImmA/IrrE family metallo-endopeptidase [Streptomyces monomycini]|uniref:ImmA/IrrE family metallo-endopeptidase n=1 Tax=Streptomyces monomycini TaxID=371720 RepID=UPI001EEC75BB|nr:ImmA/IrrE family metallo-endopeptidase [Streptomyces monomycini]